MDRQEENVNRIDLKTEQSESMRQADVDNPSKLSKDNSSDSKTDSKSLKISHEKPLQKQPATDTLPSADRFKLLAPSTNTHSANRSGTRVYLNAANLLPSSSESESETPPNSPVTPSPMTQQMAWPSTQGKAFQSELEQSALNQDFGSTPFMPVTQEDIERYFKLNCLDTDQLTSERVPEATSTESMYARGNSRETTQPFAFNKDLLLPKETEIHFQGATAVVYDPATNLKYTDSDTSSESPESTPSQIQYHHSLGEANSSSLDIPEQFSPSSLQVEHETTGGETSVYTEATTLAAELEITSPSRSEPINITPQNSRKNEHIGHKYLSPVAKIYTEVTNLESPDSDNAASDSDDVTSGSYDVTSDEPQQTSFEMQPEMQQFSSNTPISSSPQSPGPTKPSSKTIHSSVVKEYAGIYQEATNLLPRDSDISQFTRESVPMRLSDRIPTGPRNAPQDKIPEPIFPSNTKSQQNTSQDGRFNLILAFLVGIFLTLAIQFLLKK